MNFLIQHGKIRSQVINVPDGLPELLSDITREVLRCQPSKEALCQFIIDYLHAVIKAREKARMAKLAIDRALRMVNEVIADMCICDIPKIKADKMSEAMEDCFKRFLSQWRCGKGRNIEFIKFNEIDIFDELMKKCKFSENELKASKPVIEAAYQRFVEAYMTANQNGEGPEALYQYFREREVQRQEERVREEAAVKIQSNVRGFLARRSLFAKKEVETPVEELSEPYDLVKEQEEAALKIQRFFRRRMSNIRKRATIQEFEFNDVCEPESRISLTANTPAPVNGQQEDTNANGQPLEIDAIQEPNIDQLLNETETSEARQDNVETDVITLENNNSNGA
ncbi:uncharacterized protein LOC106083268 [Stomoxys calcitrans]|uniref:uncharacterized protein LOC106083268 n=1 Tax=Stomoxys calcitrans TaxID=35570 RepID=UPI0027E2C58B|nr:uncharacterized protein LOC106083268 [Stomoxys calcitrans]